MERSIPASYLAHRLQNDISLLIQLYVRLANYYKSTALLANSTVYSSGALMTKCKLVNMLLGAKIVVFFCSLKEDSFKI